jgi:hypothetical protein
MNIEYSRYSEYAKSNLKGRNRNSLEKINKNEMGGAHSTNEKSYKMLVERR